MLGRSYNSLRPAMVKTRILIISDTHCAALTQDGHKRVPNAAFKLPLPETDVLIHCGDMTMQGEIQEYNQTLDMLKQIKAATKLVIAGNHDLSLDKEWTMSHTQDRYARPPAGMSVAEAEQYHKQAREIWTGENGRAKQEGITFLDEGTHSITLPNGALLNVYASPYTPEFYDWGFPYERDEDRFNDSSVSISGAQNIASNIIPPRIAAQSPIDIVITHGPPWQRLDPTKAGIPAGCPHLLQAIKQARPMIHCFGHIHEGWGCEKVRWSDDVDEVVKQKHGISEYKHKYWKEGIADVSMVGNDPTDNATVTSHAAYLNASAQSAQPLEVGKETLFVNAAIMTVNYSPRNAPWLIDIDLPSHTSTESRGSNI